MANTYRVFLYKPEAVSVTADNAGPYFLGELLVDNLDVSIKLQDISTVAFDMPRIINGEANTRIDEVLDGYVIELWYGDLTGTVDVDYYRYRFTIYTTPVNFSDNKFLHNYTGYSLEALTELKMLVSWPGIEISDFYRKISYNNTLATPKFLEPKDTVTGGNFEYTITTSGSGADYITVTPTTAVATDIDIFIYEVRQRLSGGNVVSESEAGLIPYSGTGPDDAGFKNGYYFLTISGGYVTEIDIALPDNYTDFNGESVSAQLLFFKLYDNPLSRRYAIGLTTNAEQANDMYIDLAHDVAEGNPTDYEDFNFQTQTFYSKNGLTLKQVLLGKENTSTTTITEDGLLYRTGFGLGTVHASLENVYRSNLEFNNVTRYAAIKTLAESFDAIAVYDTVNNTVSFYPENIYGVNNGLIIRYGAYLKSLNKEIDASKIITNAIGLGKDNLTINLVNPTGENYWEDYSYYLDDYYISNSGQIENLAEDVNLGIDFDYVDTTGYSSRWMSASLAEKVAKWQYTRDWFHSILTGDYNPTGFSSTITQFYNFYTNRLEAIRLLIKQETEYYTALKREVKFEAFKNYYEKLYKDNPDNETYEEKYNYYAAEFTAAKAANEALYSDLEDARADIFDVDTAGSYAAKMVVLQGFLQKDSVSRNIDLDSLTPFQRETVVNDSSIDDEKDLLDIVKTHVEENKEPKVTVSIDIADILAAQEAQEDWNKVKVGDKINIYLDELNVDVVAQIREINVNFEDHSLSFVISTVRNYNKGFGNFVLKTIRNLYNANNNNVQYEIDGNRYSRETSENVNTVLENGINTSDTTVQTGLVDDSGNTSTQTSGAGTTSAAINEVDPLTETVTSYVSANTQGVIIADGKFLAYHNYTSPTTYSSEVEISADTGFTIRKISGGTIDKQVYIDTEGNAVFAGQLVVNGSAQTIDDVFDNIEDQIDAGTTVYRANDETGLTTATSSANTNDILLITGTFTASAVTYTKDDIYKFNGSSWDLDLDLKTKITGSVGGWTINSTDIKANNNKMSLHSDSDNSGWNPYISIGQTTEGYDQNGAFMGIVGETGSGNGVAKLSLKNSSNGLFWDGTDLTVTGAVNATSGSFSGVDITGTLTMGASGSISIDNGDVLINDSGINISSGAVTIDAVNGIKSSTTGTFALGLDGTGSIGGFSYGADYFRAGSDNTKILLKYDSANPYISIGQSTNGYNQEGIFLGLDSSVEKFSITDSTLLSELTFEESFTYSATMNISNGSGTWTTDAPIYNATGGTSTTQGFFNIEDGATTSAGTGPSGPYQGTRFMYYESSGTSSLTRDLIFTYTSTTTTLNYISFYYHMYGSSTTSLTLYRNGTTEILWQKTGDQGDKWYEATVPVISGTSTLRFRVVGDAGGFTSDISLDHIRVYSKLNKLSFDPNSGLYLAGNITATSGEIGGFDIGANQLTSGFSSTRVGVSDGSTTSSIAFYAGSETATSAPFRVSNTGALTTTSGFIGEWSINSTGITSPVAFFDDGGGTFYNGISKLDDGWMGVYESSGTINSTTPIYYIHPLYGFSYAKGANPLSIVTPLVNYGANGISDTGTSSTYNISTENRGITISTELTTGSDLSLNSANSLYIRAGLSNTAGRIYVRSAGVTGYTSDVAMRNPDGFGSTSTHTQISSKIVKENFETIEDANILEFLDKIEIKKFNYKSNKYQHGVSFVIEDEIEKQTPFINDMSVNVPDTAVFDTFEDIPEYLKPYNNTEYLKQKEDGKFYYSSTEYSTTNLAGVSLASIQLNHRRIKELEEENKKLKEEIALIKQKLGL